MTAIELIDQYYPADRKVRGILLSHSQAVAAEALAIARRLSLPLSDQEISDAAMLHDVGIIAVDAAGIDCHGSSPYVCHGVIGADMIRCAGMPEKYARVAERHTGAGLTSQEIAASGLPLPLDRSYMPETLLERLICYADCFYRKTGIDARKPIEKVRASMQKFGVGVAERFERLNDEFGQKE